MAADTSNGPPHVIVRGGAAGFAQEIEIGRRTVSKAMNRSLSAGQIPGRLPYDFLPGRARHLHVDDDLAVCATKGLAARECNGLAASVENSRSRLRRLRDQAEERSIGSSCEIQLTRRPDRPNSASKLMEIANRLPGPSDAYLEIDIRTRAV